MRQHNFTLLIYLAVLVGCISAHAIDEKEYTFKQSATRRSYATGRLNLPIDSKLPKSSAHIKAGATYPGSFDLRKLYPLTPIKDQKSCGSCVYFAGVATFEDEMIIAGQATPLLSPQFIMDRVDWSCDGSIFEMFGDGLVKAGGIPTLASYPYRAYNQRPQPAGQLYGKIVSKELIESSSESIIAMLNARHPVMTTVAASNSFMNYQSGVFNACDSNQTNHENEIVGYDCETSKDAAGNCVLPLPNGVGFWIVRNSWNTGYGEQGWYRIKMTDSRGNRCNAIAEEVGILHTGLAPIVPVDGGWSAFGPWSACLNGQQAHFKTCTNPSPSNGGKDCVGAASETQTCVLPPVPTPTKSSLLGLIIVGLVGLVLGAGVVLIVDRK